ncbi:hypothetical protein [Streptomyces sp. NPDC016845]|uniref:hypothetical protein n=1 Tax=Streptomyces sp. NPDC016845 TaxID=3364972 RepID=UPI00378D8959
MRTAGDDTFLLIADLMSGCGLRNAEAAAVDLPDLVSRDVYRVTAQVNQTSGHYARLKHRKIGEYRGVPLPARTRRTIAPARRGRLPRLRSALCPLSRPSR